MSIHPPIHLFNVCVSGWGGLFCFKKGGLPGWGRGFLGEDSIDPFKGDDEPHFAGYVNYRQGVRFRYVEYRDGDAYDEACHDGFEYFFGFKVFVGLSAPIS